MLPRGFFSRTWLPGLLLLLGGLAGCKSSQPAVAPARLNDLNTRVLQFTGDGRLVQDLKGLSRQEKDLFSYRPSPDEDASSYLHRMFTELRRQRPRHVVVFAHGGLVSFKAGMGRVVAIEQDRRLQLWRPHADTAFLYLNWNAGLLSTYGEHLVTNQGQVMPVRGFVRDGFRGLGRGVGLVGVNLAADLGRGLLRFPLNVVQYFSDAPRMMPLALGDPATFYRLDTDPGPLLPGPDFSPVTAVNRHGGWLAQAYQQDPGGALRVAMGRAISGSNPWYTHFTESLKWLPARAATVLIGEAIGRPAWRSMLRRTQTMFHRPAPAAVLYDEPASLSLQVQLRKSRQTVVRRPSRREETVPYLFMPGILLEFADSLEAYRRWRTQLALRSPATARPPVRAAAPDPSRPSVTLIGHSMGAIVMSQLLEERRTRLQCDQILYLAAACNLRDFRTKVVPYLRQHPNTHFYNLTLHPYSEVNENMLAGVLNPTGEGWLPSLRLPVDGSLLVAIDRLLTEPLTPAERTLGRWHNVVLAAYDTSFVPQAVRRRVTLKAFGFGPQGQYGPQYHGDFDNVRLPIKGGVPYPDPFWTQRFREAPLPASTGPGGAPPRSER